MPERSPAAQMTRHRREPRRAAVERQGMALGHAAQRIAQQEPDEQCQDHAGHPNDEERGPPRQQLRQIAAADGADERSGRNAERQQSQSEAAPLRGIEIAHQRHRRRLHAGLADADGNAANHQLNEVAHQARQDQEQGPESDRRRDQFDPVVGVRETGDRQTEDRVEQGEPETGNEPELEVAERQILLDRGTHGDGGDAIDGRAGIDRNEGRYEQRALRGRRLRRLDCRQRHHTCLGCFSCQRRLASGDRSSGRV